LWIGWCLDVLDSGHALSFPCESPKLSCRQSLIDAMR
jgi:hypothetical protein